MKPFPFLFQSSLLGDYLTHHWLHIRRLRLKRIKPKVAATGDPNDRKCGVCGECIPNGLLHCKHAFCVTCLLRLRDIDLLSVLKTCEDLTMCVH